MVYPRKPECLQEFIFIKRPNKQLGNKNSKNKKNTESRNITSPDSRNLYEVPAGKLERADPTRRVQGEWGRSIRKTKSYLFAVSTARA